MKKIKIKNNQTAFVFCVIVVPFSGWFPQMGQWLFIFIAYNVPGMVKLALEPAKCEDCDPSESEGAHAYRTAKTKQCDVPKECSTAQFLT